MPKKFEMGAKWKKYERKTKKQGKTIRTNEGGQSADDVAGMTKTYKKSG